MDRQLTGLGPEQRAGGGHDVAQVPVLEGVVDGFAHAFVVDVKLDAAAGRAKGCVLQGGKTGLAHHAFEHHAAGNADLDPQRLQLFIGLVAVFGKQGCRTVLRLDVVGECDACAAQCL